MASDRSAPPVAYAFMGLAITLWGTSFWPTEVAGQHGSSLALSALRTLPAAFVLLAVMPMFRARLPRGRVAAWSALTGVLMVTVFFYGLTEGTIRAGAGNAAVLANTSPFIVLLLGRLFGNERISALGTAGLVVGFSGVVVMVSSQLGAGGDGVVLGMVLAMTAAVAWGVGTVLVKSLVSREEGLDLVGFTAGQYAVGGLALALAALLFSEPGDVEWTSTSLWVPVAYLAVGNSALGSIAYFAALKRLTATRAAAGQFLVPAVAILVDVARGSAPGIVVLGGMALTVLGVSLANLPARTAAGASDPVAGAANTAAEAASPPPAPGPGAPPVRVATPDG
jgi:drug/metabolite transporter (DMT)-like permease